MEQGLTEARTFIWLRVCSLKFREVYSTKTEESSRSHISNSWFNNKLTFQTKANLINSINTIQLGRNSSIFNNNSCSKCISKHSSSKVLITHFCPTLEKEAILFLLYKLIVPVLLNDQFKDAYPSNEIWVKF